MPVTIAIQPTPAPPPEHRRKRWTRTEVAFLASTELFQGKRYELIDGELIDKMSMNEPHAVAIALLNVWLVRIFGSRVRIQLPVDMRPEDNPTNEPEPDAVVLHQPIEQLQGRRPGPADIALIVEAADSTLRLDTTEKAALYARAGIPEYWTLDIRQRTLRVHREPVTEKGVYQSIVSYSEDESLSCLAAPGEAILPRQFLAQA